MSAIIDNKKILVSIVTIVYNGESYIEETINSVLGQSYPYIEYIIIDGGSTDRTLSIIKKYESRISKFVSEKDNGISSAFNKGIKLATGHIIGIINADDWYEPDAIKNIVENYNDDLSIICGGVKLYNNSTTFRHKKSTLNGLEREMNIWHPGTFVPSKIYKEIGLYDENIKILMDYDFIIRCFLSGINFVFPDINIACMRYGGVSNSLIEKSMRESLRIKNKYFGFKLRHIFHYIYFLIYYRTLITAKNIYYK